MANTHCPLQTKNYLTTQPGTIYVSHAYTNDSSPFPDIKLEEVKVAVKAAAVAEALALPL